jgi:hypothetical protein
MSNRKLTLYAWILYCSKVELQIGDVKINKDKIIIRYIKKLIKKIISNNFFYHGF